MKHLPDSLNRVTVVIAQLLGLAGWIAIVTSAFTQDQALAITGLVLALAHQVIENGSKERRLDQIEARLKRDN